LASLITIGIAHPKLPSWTGTPNEHRENKNKMITKMITNNR
jgi:hypothetical protein